MKEALLGHAISFSSQFLMERVPEKPVGSRESHARSQGGDDCGKGTRGSLTETASNSLGKNGGASSLYFEHAKAITRFIQRFGTRAN